MATKVNQQETLFRFVSIRPPELTNPKSKTKFVLHPGDSGVFYAAVASKPTTQTKWEAMEIEADKFTPYKETDIESIYSDQWETSNWLAKNKSNATPEEIKAKTETINPISPENIITLWDNLFYQVIKQNDFYVKEQVNQLLVLENLTAEIKRIGDPTEVLKVIKQLADTRTVLPVELFVEDKTEETPPTVDEETLLFSTKELTRSLDSSFAKYAVKRNETAVNELLKLQKNYEQEYNTKFDEINRKYEQDVEAAYSEATYVEKEGIECATKCTYTYREYENLNLPVYQFTPPVEIDPLKLKDDLSEESYYVVESLDLLQQKTYREIIEGIEKSTNSYSRQIFDTLPDQKVVSLGGMVFMNNSSEKNTNPFLDQSQLPYVASFKNTSSSGKGKLFIAIDTGYAGAEIASASYSARIGETDFSEKSLESEADGNMVNFTLFPKNNGLVIPDGTTEFTLNATVTLTNATTFDISKTMTLGDSIKGVGNVTTRNNETVKPNIAFEPFDFGIRRLGIADYKKVVSEVCCYRESEVSHIENIMAREFRSKTTERERIEENTVTTENVFEKENLTDTSTTERLEMQTEVAKVLQQQKQMGAYATVSGSYGGVAFETGGNYATNTAKEQSNLQAVIESKEITETASERITTRFREEIVRKITERFREENSHIFDNRAGENHVSGVYRFINGIYKNQIYNYGKRLMYEFMIPDPSRLHRLGSEIPTGANQTNTNQTITMEMPLPPSAGGMTNSTQVVDSNYREFAAMNNASVEAPPEQYPVIGKSFQGKGINGASSTEYNTIKVPDGYRATQVQYSFTMMKSNVNLYAKLQIGKDIIPIAATGVGASYVTSHNSGVWFANDKYMLDTIPISVIGWDLGAYVLNITVSLERTTESYQNWQIKTYNTLIAAYNERVNEYNQQVSQVQEEADTMLGTNPLFFREIEQITLKRNCISYLLNNNNMGNGYSTGDTFTNYSVTRNQAMDDYASLSKFMEQAFEWNIMSYNFYPYYWADSDKWIELYQTENDDPIFRKFMQAGMARVIVTVKPGFEDAVMYFMMTKKIWNGGQVPTLGDPLYLSIVEELKEQEYFIEESWETVVPTSLIGLQKGGVAIDIEGLPCGDGCEGGDNPLIPDNSKLGPDEPANP